MDGRCCSIGSHSPRTWPELFSASRAFHHPFAVISRREVSLHVSSSRAKSSPMLTRPCSSLPCRVVITSCRELDPHCCRASHVLTFVVEMLNPSSLARDFVVASCVQLYIRHPPISSLNLSSPPRLPNPLIRVLLAVDSRHHKLVFPCAHPHRPCLITRVRYRSRRRFVHPQEIQSVV
jgi:hypothetical protein